MSEIIAAGLSAAAAALGYWLVHRVNRKNADTNAAQQQIDQIQEDREADRKHAERLDARQGRLEQRLELMEGLNRIASDYILGLRWHIAEGKPPPPPAFPPELLAPLEPRRHKEPEQ